MVDDVIGISCPASVTALVVACTKQFVTARTETTGEKSLIAKKNLEYPLSI